MASNPFGNDSYRNDAAPEGANPFGNDDNSDGARRPSDGGQPGPGGGGGDAHSPQQFTAPHEEDSFESSPEGGSMPVSRLSFGGSPQPQPYAARSPTGRGRGDRGRACDGGTRGNGNRVLARSASMPSGVRTNGDGGSAATSSPLVGGDEAATDCTGDITATPSDQLLASDTQLVQELGLTWEDNDAATNCWCCERSFNLVRRKHHCRMCGHVVCWDCSSQKMVVPGFDTKQRVCKKCSSSWIERLVMARRSVQQLKVELEQTEMKVGELSYQKSRLQAKNAELVSTVEGLRADVAQQRSVTEELHQQLEDKTMHIMKLKKQVAAATSSKKDKKKAKRASQTSGGGGATGGGGDAEADAGKLNPDWKPPSAFGGSSGSGSSDMLADVYGLDGEGGHEGPGAPARVDESCKCVIS